MSFPLFKFISVDDPMFVCFGFSPNIVEIFSIYYIYRANRYILLDCGEGTYGQMMRFFGQEKIVDVMTNLTGIFISHLHADHHNGLIGLLLGTVRLLFDISDILFHKFHFKVDNIACKVKSHQTDNRCC